MKKTFKSFRIFKNLNVENFEFLDFKIFRTVKSFENCIKLLKEFKFQLLISLNTFISVKFIKLTQNLSKLLSRY